jgi:hypothetical protein
MAQSPLGLSRAPAFRSRQDGFNDSLKRLFLLGDSLNGNQSALKPLRGRIGRSKNRNRIKAQSIGG